MGRLLLHTLADSGQRVYSDKSIFQAIFTIAYHCCILVLTCTLFLLISGSQVRVLVRPPNSPQNTVCYALGGKLPDGAVSVPVWCPQEGLSAPARGSKRDPSSGRALPIPRTPIAAFYSAHEDVSLFHGKRTELLEW